MSINLGGSTTFLVAGVILLYIQLNVYSLFREGYRITRSKQLMLITHAFTFFILATVSMIAINLWMTVNAGLLSGMEETALRKASLLIYNTIFAVGLFLLLLSTSERIVIGKEMKAEALALAAVSAAILTLVADLATNIELIEQAILITNIAVLLEGTFLLSQYILYSEKGVIMGKLWTLGVLMIMFSRGVDILPEKPFTELFLILTDTVVFLLLYLMKKEAEIQVKG